MQLCLREMTVFGLVTVCRGITSCSFGCSASSERLRRSCKERAVPDNGETRPSGAIDDVAPVPRCAGGCLLES